MAFQLGISPEEGEAAIFDLVNSSGLGHYITKNFNEFKT